jgi:hypothetical protein
MGPVCCYVALLQDKQDNGNNGDDAKVSAQSVDRFPHFAS